MKKIFLLLACALILSCSDDDGTGPITDEALIENWHMRTYNVFGPELPELDNGDVTWNFSDVDNTVTIENNVEDDYSYLPESGEYPFTLLPNNIIFIEGLPGGNTYYYKIEGQQMFMTFRDNPQISDDELSIGFQKF